MAHMGNGIKFFRESIKGWSQSGLAEAMGPDWDQQKVSYYETKETIDEDILQGFAQALGVDPEILRHFSKEAAVTIFSNVTTNASANGSYASVHNINHIKDIMELLDQKVAAVEKKYEERIAAYEKKIDDLTNMLLEKGKR